jgi:hypothetical protein
MSDSREEIEAKVRHIVDHWQAEADPVKALEALKRNAPKDMGGFFAMLASELAMAMNEIEERK